VTGEAIDGELWRRLARWGSSGPEWFVRAAPPLIGLAACVLATERRRHVTENLKRMHGERSPVRRGLDVARTFATYAAYLAEVLRAGAGGERGRSAQVLVRGELNLTDALVEGRGVLFATAHTAGWEIVGPVLSRDLHVRVMIAELAERDERARNIQDAARAANGVLVAHVGGDPLSALPLARHLREGGAVALQIDRAPAGMRTREVTMFGAPARIPEGPLRLAAATGAPVLPVFAARLGYRRYLVDVRPPVRLAHRPNQEDLDRAAQQLAASLEAFVKPRPTQWFHFRG
jgi:KDO2-lipid IV(A) lauroyltransferase